MTTFSTRRMIPAGPAAVFAAFRDPGRLATRWGPDGFTNSFDTFEFRPGGRWVFTMHGPTGTSYPNESTFVAIDPDIQIIIRHDSPPRFQLTITLQADPAGTLLTWEQAFEDEAMARAIRHIVEPANEQNLDRLSAEVRSIAPPGL